MDQSNFSTKTIHSFEELINTIHASMKLEEDSISRIHSAYEYAKKKHFGQLRKNGDEFISHVLTVANYIAQLKLDEISVISALLHDTVEKSDASIDEIDKVFGTSVAYIVDGLDDIRRFSRNITGEDSNREEFKKLIFNSTEDVRILIIRMAEKLHNLCTITEKDSDESINAAKRALNIYAPLCEYLNLSSFQRELEDRSFEIVCPKEYQFIKSAVQKYLYDQQSLIDEFKERLLGIFSNYSALKNLTLTSRKKGLYSIFKKIKKKYADKYGGINEESFSKVLDIYAARVLVNTVEECYMVLGLIQSSFEVVQEEFSDYIVDPKDNGYRSIHVIVKFKGFTFEIQIRTYEMHEYNEYGPASHIAYKAGGSTKVLDMTWTKDLVKWQGSEQKEVYKIKAFSNSIFVFTPKGLVVRLEKGSTPIDFAFRIHTEIGKCYKGAKVNGKLVSMSTVLQTGDVVEILTQNKPNLSLDWINIAKMNSTKSKIRRCLGIYK
ncbi:bifunctional (p)ppGpp synthetase/guanosine-3',5'-bis(diphosphate) 3'-pyrophosphohydrolase [Candidatus Dojkabacteria bacterium]|uniref:Bifunctional (P)ppGpp synthetase/guanosine-3',5'-bis(Diphosphate) 3'-pyrophosphohydrolase n=1 Tax=Candidatus Dojkabacteria bacterium TaxID=2099670 RepID=A0A3M0YZS4_9BACT|nr:MAG: bifunctional (p)ppGpp synthetase/guanosine-3',5'-bis(diphosphate) 3'-pyrophosphohydrolase [Candidatus Dojkabacteria bacterium]